MTTVGRVAALAKRHGIEIAEDQAAFFADQFARLATVDGDDTLRLIADLMCAGIISDEDGTALTLVHVREIADD